MKCGAKPGKFALSVNIVIVKLDDMLNNRKEIQKVGVSTVIFNILHLIRLQPSFPFH